MGKKNTKMKATGIMLVLIIMLMAGLIYINNLNSASSLSSKSISSLALMGQVEAKAKESKIAAVEDLLVEATGAVVKAFDFEGKAIWNKTLTGKVDSMKGVGSRLFILDSSKKLYCISKEGKLIWEKQMEENVKDYYIDRNGDILVDYLTEQGSRIEIVSSKGVAEGGMVLENAYVLAFAAGKDENTLSVIDISSQTIKTKLLTLNLRGDMVWSENIDNQIIAKVGYTKDNSLIAIGEKAIYKYKNQNKVQSELALSKTIYNSSISDSTIAVTVRGKSGYEVHTYDANLKEIGILEQENSPVGIFLGKSNYILYSSEKLHLADLRGEILAEYNSMREIKRAYFGADNSIFVESDRLLQKLSY